MTVSAASDIYFDPYDVHEAAPLYYNVAYDFFALSRFDDVELTDAKLSPTSTVRGWETMPTVIG